MTLKFVFLIEGKESALLEQVLAEDPYDKQMSFVGAGYTLKESNAVGLDAGNKIIYFKTELKEVADKLLERLKKITTLKEITKEQKDKIIAQIEKEEENAAVGFGSIFG